MEDQLAKTKEARTEFLSLQQEELQRLPDEKMQQYWTHLTPQEKANVEASVAPAKKAEIMTLEPAELAEKSPEPWKLWFWHLFSPEEKEKVPLAGVFSSRWKNLRPISGARQAEGQQGGSGGAGQSHDRATSQRPARGEDPAVLGISDSHGKAGPGGLCRSRKEGRSPDYGACRAG